MTQRQTDRSFIAEFLRTRAGQTPDAMRLDIAEQRLVQVALSNGLESSVRLVAWLRTGERPDLERATLEALVNNETTFFRDVRSFKLLRETVLPELIERRRASRRLRIWSAACASGQEVYSLAMLLTTNFPELAGWDLDILGSDLLPPHLERARSGRYRQQEVMRGLPAAMLVEHFTKDGTDWILSERIRNMVRLRELNLAKPWPPMPQMDLVLLRNVMIYFDAPAKQEVLGRVARALAQDGFLLLGGTESVLGVGGDFQPGKAAFAGSYELTGRPR